MTLTTLSTLLLIYVILLLLNFAFAMQLWRVYRTPAYKTLMIIWLCTTLNFLLQGIFSDSISGSLLTFPTYIVVVYFTCSLLTQVSSMPFTFKPFGIAFTVSLLISWALYWQSDSFTLIALPVAITIGAPQVFFAIKKLFYYRHTGTQFSNSFAVLLLCNGLHFFDYPFLRPIPEMAIFGFGVVLVFSVGFAALLPTILSKYHTDRSDALIEEIKKRKQVEKELERAVNKAEKLADTKAEFLANMSHEIRTPLTGIMGLNDLLLTTSLQPEQREYCEDIRYASHVLRRIINNVLSLSKLESGTIAPDCEVFSLPLLCDEVKKHYDLDPSPSITISYRYTDVQLLGDKYKIQQILFNLIDNAIKYSQGSAINVCCIYDKTEALLTLVVADNGVGIAPNLKAQLFERFEQQYQSPVGVGLGLAIVRQLLVVMRGHITFASNAGEGATFTCSIPLPEPPHALIASASTTETSSQRANTARSLTSFAGSKTVAAMEMVKVEKQYHILLIDDDPATLYSLSELLRQAGYICYLAEDGSTAKTVLASETIDAIVSDIQLPDVEDLELIQYFREMNPILPVIAHSAFAFDEDAAAALAAGATDYLRKPATFAELHSVLTANLTSQKGL
ncbi:hybrid sensor histidine kinase/response regulator [Eionea flava]